MLEVSDSKIAGEDHVFTPKIIINQGKLNDGANASLKRDRTGSLKKKSGSKTN